MNPPAVSVTSLSILGSCVSRDCLPPLGFESRNIAQYTARHSLLSEGHDLGALFPENHGITSPFQLQALRTDFAGNGVSQVVEKSTDVQVILWDITDERGGVYRVPAGEYGNGGIITRSFDTERNDSVREALSAANAEVIAFGTDEHFEMWSSAANETVARLKSAHLLEKTVLLAVPWAMITTEFKPTGESFGINAVQANALFERYYEHFENLGVTIIEPNEELVVADSEHVWGSAPFHYITALYEDLIAKVEQAQNVSFPHSGDDSPNEEIS